MQNRSTQECHLLIQRTWDTQTQNLRYFIECLLQQKLSERKYTLKKFVDCLWLVVGLSVFNLSTNQKIDSFKVMSPLWLFFSFNLSPRAREESSTLRDTWLVCWLFKIILVYLFSGSRRTRPVISSLLVCVDCHGRRCEDKSKETVVSIVQNIVALSADVILRLIFKIPIDK